MKPGADRDLRLFLWFLIGCIAVVTVALLLADKATAEFGDARLDAVASAFASRPVTVTCASAEEDGIFNVAWGYVLEPLNEQTVAHIFDEACAGALAIDEDTDSATDYMKAIGAATLIHESYHLRIVKGNGDEALTECRSMRHYDVVLRKLGASEGTVDRLMPLMLLNHWRLRALTEDWNNKPGSSIFGKPASYHRSGCDMPLRFDRYLGFPPR